MSTHLWPRTITWKNSWLVNTAVTSLMKWFLFAPSIGCPRRLVIYCLLLTWLVRCHINRSTLPWVKNACCIWIHLVDHVFASQGETRHVTRTSYLLVDGGVTHGDFIASLTPTKGITKTTTKAKVIQMTLVANWIVMTHSKLLQLLTWAEWIFMHTVLCYSPPSSHAAIVICVH